MAQSNIRWWESGRNLGFAGTVVATLVAAALLAAFEGVRAWASILWRVTVYPVPVPLVLLTCRSSSDQWLLENDADRVG